MRRVVDVLERGGIDIHFRAEELDRLMDKAEKTGNRIVAGLITAALINAVGELVSAQPENWRNWPKTLFTAGIGGVGALGAYLAAELPAPEVARPRHAGTAQRPNRRACATSRRNARTKTASISTISPSSSHWLSPMKTTAPTTTRMVPRVRA